jgi:hypothetical protein
VKIRELLTSPTRLSLAASVETAHLLHEGMLEEAALFDIRLNAVDATAWLLFDCKGALQIRRGNTAIVVLRGVRSLEWNTPALAPRMWQRVAGWRTRTEAGGERSLALALEVAEVRAVFKAAEFLVGDVPGADDAPPDFADATDGEIAERLQSWESPIVNVMASFFE